jgi:hypothetical protein
MSTKNFRTTAGRHVLFDHVLRAIEGPHGRVARRFVFFVNRHGILQNEQRRRKPRK